MDKGVSSSVNNPRRRFLITGGSGFVGSCLLRRLVADGQEVHVFLRRESRMWRIDDLKGRFIAHECDLLDHDRVVSMVGEIRPTVVYHLAAYGAYSYQNEADRILKANIDGAWNLLQACRGIDLELFVNTGSSSEYGFKKEPMKEGDVLEPASYYAVAKSAQTLLCSHFARSEKKPVVTFRLFSVYGPYEEPARLIPTLMKALDQGLPMNMVSPHIARDLIYVDDVVDAYLMVDRLKACAGECFNIATGVQSSMADVVRLAEEISGKMTEIRWSGMPSRSWDTEKWVADIQKAGTMLEWKSATTIHEGLAKTWAWFGSHRQMYV